MIDVVWPITWNRYDDMEVDRMLVRSLIYQIIRRPESYRSVISELTDERSRNDRQVVCPGEIAKSRS